MPLEEKPPSRRNLLRAFGIVLAADLATPEENLALVSKVGRVVDGVKLPVATLLRAGLDVVRRFRDLAPDCAVLLDLKVADIGLWKDDGWVGTNKKIIASLEGCGATHVTLHGFPGASSTAEAAAACKEAGLHGLVIPAMSHPGGASFFSLPVDPLQFQEDMGCAGEAPNEFEGAPGRTVTDAILAMGDAFGLHGFIGPASRPETLRRYRAVTRLPVWCPGFGRQDPLGRTMQSQLHDWASSLGPESAAIIGSEIYGAPDPLRASHELAALRDSVVAALTGCK
jgi:orotidine-5'-phosphate decarboxylase